MTVIRFALVFAALVWGWALRPALAQSGPATAPVLAIETPECIVSQSGRADCLARDRLGRFVWQFHDGRRWSRPQVLAGAFAGRASCVVRGPLGFNCFAIKRDGTLWHAALNGGRWRPWRPLGGRLALGRPSCVAPARNQIVCHARSREGTLAVKAWLGDQIWQEWRDSGGDLGGDPSCVKLTAERVSCFWRRPDGRWSGLFPAETGPGAAVLSLPRPAGPPVCARLGADRVTCLGRGPSGQAIEWRGNAVLGSVGVDGFRPGVVGLTGDPVCATRADRTLCAYVTPGGALISVEATPEGWSAPTATGMAGAAASGGCFLFDTLRTACIGVSREGELRAAFRETRGALSGANAIPALPQVVEKPAVPEMPPIASPGIAVLPATPHPIAPVSVREPLGVWRVFEPRSGLHCQIILFDAPAQPYRSLTRDADCAALTSLRGVDRWSQSEGGVFLRDRRGRVYFRFFEAGPTALRARWRRNDFIMMARDLRAFAPDTKAPAPVANAASPPQGLAGVWRVRGPGRQTCTVRLSVDPASAATRAEPQGCQGVLARADGWSFRRGAIVLERQGAPLARFVEGRGVVWHGRFEGGRRTLRMDKQ